ncbi:DUF2267 domain-containing protein [Ostreiculturibacter nitratireducens]|uniref:DUF2267 domain-containing protein n=1 Tax=Ostreiculturibacter nitratireducens TaxID=3075226 RepID=UPI0031B6063B
MSALGLKIIDEAVQTANVWLNEVDYRTGWDDKQRGYRLMRAVLHAIRDHLTVDEAADLGAQLPTLIRGIYYEGWNPSRNPVKMRTAKAFEDRIQKSFETDPLGDAPHAIGAVIDVLDAHISAGEMKDVREAFTKEIRALFDA